VGASATQSPATVSVVVTMVVVICSGVVWRFPSESSEFLVAGLGGGGVVHSCSMTCIR
jgi:hypothetical protein